jgi:ribosomal protein S18 acetylase RimI-like enzyme
VSGKLRPPTDADVPAIVLLASEHSPEPVGEDDVKRSWTSPEVHVERDVRYEGTSYGMVESIGDGRAWIELRGDPSPAMLNWAEARAVEIAPRLFSGGWSGQASLLRALEERGFRLIRHSHRMLIDLSRPTPAPVWPDGIECRTFRAGDERTFYDVYVESFKDSWEPIEESYEMWAHWLLDGPSFVPDLWFLALEGDEPTGAAICHPHETAEDLGWVRILGVRRPWRKRGLGRALLLEAFAAFRERGFARAGLGVDAESVTGANRLYEQAGMHVSARFDVYEKVLT